MTAVKEICDEVTTYETSAFWHSGAVFLQTVLGAALNPDLSNARAQCEETAVGSHAGSSSGP